MSILDALEKFPEIPQSITATDPWGLVRVDVRPSSNSDYEAWIRSQAAAVPSLQELTEEETLRIAAEHKGKIGKRARRRMVDDARKEATKRRAELRRDQLSDPAIKAADVELLVVHDNDGPRWWFTDGKGGWGRADSDDQILSDLEVADSRVVPHSDDDDLGAEYGGMPVGRAILAWLGDVADDLAEGNRTYETEVADELDPTPAGISESPGDR